MGPNLSASTVVNAPKGAVWAILADFGNIADYTSQVKTSVLTSDSATGVGASRHCDLAPFGTTEEVIKEFVPEERLVIYLHDIKGLPVKGTLSTFTLEAMGESQTQLTMTSRVEAKGGIFSGFIGKRLSARLPKGLQSLVEDIAAAAELSVASADSAS